MDKVITQRVGGGVRGKGRGGGGGGYRNDNFMLFC